MRLLNRKQDRAELDFGQFVPVRAVALREALAQGGFLGGIAPGFRAHKKAGVRIRRPSPAPPLLLRLLLKGKEKSFSQIATSI